MSAFATRSCPSAAPSRVSRCPPVRSTPPGHDHNFDRKCGDKFDVPRRLYQPVYPRLFRNEDPAQPDPSAPPNAVYTVRLNTARGRGAALDDPYAGVQICLIGRNGGALLHRIPQVEDSRDSYDAMRVICEVVGEDGGAKCDLPDELHEKYRPRAPTTRRRFNEGSVDEVSFVGPNLGTLSAILVGPEQGSWQLDEVFITNSREKVTQQFICRDVIGRGDNPGAAYMTPLPPGAVVYGSGEQAVLLTTSQAESMRKVGLAGYEELKRRILGTATGLVVVGTGVAGLAGGLRSAEAFAIGGAIGFINHLLLSQSVDRLPLGAAYNGSPYNAPDFLGQQALGIGGFRGSVVGSSAFRLAVTAAVVLASLLSVQLWDGDMSEKERIIGEMSAVLTALLGFGMYKVAIVTVALTPPPNMPSEKTARTVEKL